MAVAASKINKIIGPLALNGSFEFGEKRLYRLHRLSWRFLMHHMACQRNAGQSGVGNGFKVILRILML